MHSDNDSKDIQDCEEIVEETLIHVVVDNADEMSVLNANSNVRVIAMDSDSPALQIENKVQKRSGHITKYLICILYKYNRIIMQH